MTRFRAPARGALGMGLAAAIGALLAASGFAGSAARGEWRPVAVGKPRAGAVAGHVPSSIPNLTAPPAGVLASHGGTGPPPRNLAPPAAAGRPEPGSVVTAVEGGWSNASSFSYRWLWCEPGGEECSAIPGATSWTYRVGERDAGRALRLEVTARNAAGAAAARSAPALVGGTEARTTAAAPRAAPGKPPQKSAPRNTAPPAITGEAGVGKTLTASAGSWSGSPASFRYRWLRCGASGSSCAAVAGATATAYAVTGADVGRALRVEVTAANAFGSATALSAPTAPVPPPPAPTAAPALAGSAVVGGVLAVDNGSWTSSPTSFAYRWLLCSVQGESCAPIAGIDASTYTVAAGDAGHTLRAEVTATNASGSATARSAPTGVVPVPPEPVGTTLVLYDTTGPWGWLGELYATMTANLVGHFGSYEAKPVSAYQAGEIASHPLTVYLGSTYDEPLPPAFLDDAYAASKPVIWVHDNIWQLTSRYSATWQATYGWSWSGFDTSPVAEVDYKGVALTRDPGNAGGIMAYSYVDPSRATALAAAVRADGSRFPWALRSRNLTYVGENPLAFIGETDRYYAFADLLFDALAPATPERHRALLRLEDIDPTSSPRELERIADYLSSRGVPFGFAVSPRYRDPLGAEPGANDVALRDAPQVAAAIRYLQARGGVLVEHGYTHQYDGVANPYNGVTGDDAEFYRVVESADGDLTFVGPVPEDSLAWALSRLDAARAELVASGAGAPSILEFPHYQASAADYAAGALRFSVRWERSLYFEGTLTGRPASHDHFAGQLFPYPVRDVYGSTVLPEDAGNYEPEPFHQYPAHTVDDILAAAGAATVVRDGFAGVYYHPENGLGPLQEIVTGLRDRGYEFVDPATAAAP